MFLTIKTIKKILLGWSILSVLLLLPLFTYAQESLSQEEINESVRLSIKNMISIVEQNHDLLAESARTLTIYQKTLPKNASTSEALAHAEKELGYMPKRLEVVLTMVSALPIEALFVASDSVEVWQFISEQFLLAEEHLTDIHGDLNAILILLSAPEYYSITPNPSD